MAVKRYRLTPAAAPFNNQGKFGFRARFGIPESGGRTRVAAKAKCPVIRIKQRGVLQVTNEVAQFFVEHMIVPTGTKGPGRNRTPGLMWEDVTGAGPTYDVDFDALLPVP